MADSTEKNGLIAPLWSSSEEKTKSINYIHGVMDKRELMQGSEYK
jgi:radical SAM superfamily enzyme